MFSPGSGTQSATTKHSPGYCSRDDNVLGPVCVLGGSVGKGGLSFRDLNKWIISMLYCE